MTLAEAKLVARAIEVVDGGCASCIGEVACELNRLIPSFRWAVNREFYAMPHGERVDVEEVAS